MQSVHFICRGNRFRSRIAESVFNSLNISEIRAVSSGIEPAQDEIISPWAKFVLEEYNIPFEIKPPQLTTKELLKKSDYLIVLSRDVYNDSPILNSLNPIVWDVIDIDKRTKVPLSCLDSIELKIAAREVFKEINDNINKFLSILPKNPSINP